MKGKGEPTGWITRNGVHVPIFGAYTVRGGVEPKGKRSKFKRKKRPEEFDKDIRKSGDKYFAAHSSEQGKKKGVKDLEKPFDTKEEARNFLAEKNGEREDAFEAPNAATEGESDASKGKKVEGKGAVKDVKGKKERNVLGQETDFAEVDRTAKAREKDFIVDTKIPDDPKSVAKAEKTRIAKEIADENDAYDRVHSEGKYANRDWNKDVEDSKRYGYSEQTEEGKKPVTKDEEYKSKLAEANKAFDEGDYKKANAMYKDLKKMQASGEVSDETITGKTKAQRERDEQKSQAKQKAFEANSLVNEGMDKDQARKAVTSNETSKPDFSKMSYSEAGKYVAAHKKDFGLKAGDDAYTAAYEMKNGTWKTPEAKKSVSTTESYPGTKSFGAFEPSASEYGKAMDSINKRYNREQRTVPGKEMGKVFEGLKPGDTIQVHSRWSTSPDRYVMNDDGTFDYSTPSSSFLAKKGMSLEEAQKHATNSVDNRITIMRKNTETNSNAGSRYKNASSFKSMSVSGLKSAWANATGAEKSKIKAALQAKGYVFKGGKWIKA